MRRSTLLWSFLAITVVIGLFVVKHRVQNLEDRLHALNAEIITDRDAIQVMQAEWSYLNQPARLEALSKRLLGMDAPVSAQTVSMQELLEQSTPEQTDRASLTEVATKKKPAFRPAPFRKSAPAQAPEDEDWLKPILAKLKKSQ
ncbi:MAG: hypothetical protein ACI9JL_002102 [Paracoccaceae bacterium]|jgi:hypothetical protein